MPNGFGPLGLARVYGDDAAPDGLSHVSAGVDRDHQNGGGPDVVKPQGSIGEVGQAIVHKHGLQHHGGAPEDLHIDPDDGPYNLQEELFQGMIPGSVGNGVEHAADKAKDAANAGGDQGQGQGVADTGKIGGAVLAPELPNVGG